LPDVELPWNAPEVLRGREIRISHLDELPPEAGRDRLSIASRGVRSLVVCPIVVDGKIGGSIVLNSARHERHWPDELVAAAQLLGVDRKALAGKLARDRKSTRLNSSD